MKESDIYVGMEFWNYNKEFTAIVENLTDKLVYYYWKDEPNKKQNKHINDFIRAFTHVHSPWILKSELKTELVYSLF